jgi:hypothetical protein
MRTLSILATPPFPFISARVSILVVDSIAPGIGILEVQDLVRTPLDIAQLLR